MTDTPAPQPRDTPVADLGYEQARDQLVAVVQQLESGGVGLAESLALWERGEQLARRCQEWLDGAQEKIEQAMRSRDPDDAGAAGPDVSGR